MAVCMKYGEFKIENIPDDEPIFILRAQDVFAVKLLREYRDLKSSAGDTVGAEGIEHLMRRFTAWPTKKIPD